MRGIAVGLAVVTVVGGLLVLGASVAAEDLMYYRGYFSAETVEQPLQGFWYRVDPSTLQPAFYYQYRTQPFALYSRETAPAKPGESERKESTAPVPLNPNPPVVLFSPVPLPGQYWYQEPGAYAFRTQDLGWPYGNRK